MHLGIILTRFLFSALSILFMTAYMMNYPIDSLPIKIFSGISLGATIALFLITVEFICKRCSLRMFNVAIVGLFFGYLMGSLTLLLFETLLQATTLKNIFHPFLLDILNLTLQLTCFYLGTILAFRFADEFHISIPFIRFSSSLHQKKDILLDAALLSDSRILDFCSHGLLNNQLVVPKFLLKELSLHAESTDEQTKTKAKKALDIVKKLETMPLLGLRYNDTDFPELKDSSQKLSKLARLIHANILTADTARTHTTSHEDILYINFYALSHSLKPITPPGEIITLKVQRYGKEPKQGIGYLDDGTMVVINNGGDYIGEIIETQVISVKQTSAGRIIFTNALVDDQANLYGQEPAYDHHE